MRANLLLGLIGGPSGVTAYARALGDDVTRLDRTEPTLNGNLSGDVRDTTSPDAMIALMRRILVGDALSVSSRQRLLDAMKRCRTGLKRLRAGLPAGWVVGDKTGTGERGSPLLIASFLSGATVTRSPRSS